MSQREQDEWANLHDCIRNKVRVLIDENKEIFMSARKLRNKIHLGARRLRSLDSPKSRKKDYNSRLVGHVKSQCKEGLVDFLSPPGTPQMSNRFLGDELKKKRLMVEIPRAFGINKSPLFV